MTTYNNVVLTTNELRVLNLMVDIAKIYFIPKYSTLLENRINILGETEQIFETKFDLKHEVFDASWKQEIKNINNLLVILNCILNFKCTSVDLLNLPIPFKIRKEISKPKYKIFTVNYKSKNGKDRKYHYRTKKNEIKRFI